MISIYGKDFCPYCDRAVALCEQKGLEFEYKKLGRDFTREDLMELEQSNYIILESLVRMTST